MTVGAIEFEHAARLPYVISFAILMFVISIAWLRQRWFFVRFYGKGGGRIHGQFRALCFVLLILSIGLFLGLSLCAPYIKKEMPYDVYEPIEAVVLIDISKSMLAPSTRVPCSASRLELATKEIENLINLLDNESSVKVALLVFTRYSYPAIPVPTDDYELYRRRLDMETSIDNVLEMPEGTDHWYALGRAAAIFSRTGPKKRILAIITDGDPDLPGRGPGGDRSNVITTARMMGIEVYVIGVGEPGFAQYVPMARTPDGCPDEGTGYMVQREGDKKGLKMITATDQNNLAGLAESLSGKYIHSIEGSALAETAREGILRKRETVGLDYKTSYFDLSEYLISSAIAMLAALVLARTP